MFHLRSFTRCSYFVPVQLLPTLQASWCNYVTGSAANRGLRSNGTTFTYRKIHFFPHRNLIFRIFYLNGKRPKVYELIAAQSGSNGRNHVLWPGCCVGLSWSRILRENFSAAVNVFQVFTFNKFKSTLKRSQFFFKSVFLRILFL